MKKEYVKPEIIVDEVAIDSLAADYGNVVGQSNCVGGPTPAICSPCQPGSPP